MKADAFDERKSIGILKEHAAGAKMPELSRKYEGSENTLHKWRSKYGGMEVSDAKRLREPVSENAELKRLLADSMLENVALKDVLSKKW